MDAAILAAVVESRLEAGISAGLCRLDAADKDRMVSGRVRVHDLTLELGQRILEHGQPEGALAEIDALELLGRVLGRLGGETCGYGLMMSGQDIDGEVLGSGQRGVAVGVVGDADEDERRIERYGGEGTGGEAGGPALGVHRGDDGHARAEVAEDGPEIGGV